MSNTANDAQKQTIRALFTRIAPNYDRINRLLSLGRDQHWRRRALELAQVPAGGTLLDVATGTGDIALMAAEATLAGMIVGSDLTQAMLALAKKKPSAHLVSWALSDGLSLAFPDDTFDAALSVFMMRNIPDIAQAFREQTRVVRPGGRVVCMEMTWPRRFPVSWLFNLYFFGISPLLGQLIARDRDAYTYLPRSVKAFPSPEKTAEVMKNVGLRRVSWEMKMLGTVAIFVGTKGP